MLPRLLGLTCLVLAAFGCGAPTCEEACAGSECNDGCQDECEALESAAADAGCEDELDDAKECIADEECHDQACDSQTDALESCLDAA